MKDSLERVLESISKRTESTSKRIFGTSGAPLHPNRITSLGALLTGVGVTLLYTPASNFALPVIGFSYLCDSFDGYYAKKFRLKTKEGARLDPLVDKIKNMILGGYIILNEGLQNPLLSLSVLLNFGIDYISQKDRNGENENLSDQLYEGARVTWDPASSKIDTDSESSDRANKYGKVKARIQAGVNLSYILKETWLENLSYILKETWLENYISPSLDEGINYALAVSLVISAGFACKGITERRKIRKRSGKNRV